MNSFLFSGYHAVGYHAQGCHALVLSASFPRKVGCASSSDVWPINLSPSQGSECDNTAGSYGVPHGCCTGVGFACYLPGLGEMEADGNAIPAAPEDLMQMNEAQASAGKTEAR